MHNWKTTYPSSSFDKHQFNQNINSFKIILSCLKNKPAGTKELASDALQMFEAVVSSSQFSMGYLLEVDKTRDEDKHSKSTHCHHFPCEWHCLQCSHPRLLQPN